MRTVTSTAVALAVLSVVCGCTLAEGEQAEARPAVTVPPASRADLRTVDLGPARPGAQVPIEVPPGTGSFLFSAAASGLDDELAIEDVLGPDGASVVPDQSLLDNPGEVSVLVTRPGGLAAGTYRVVLDTAVETRGTVTFKPIVPGRQVVDVRIWDATEEGSVVDRQESVLAALRARGEASFGPVDLGVGTMAVVRAPSTVVTRHRRLELPATGTERRLRELCQAMSTELGRERAVDVVAVDEIVDRTDDEVELYGSSAAIPGGAFTPAGATSCVAVVAGRPGGLAAQGPTLWHEAGHLLGLFHTSEDDGTEFDPIDDTPRCTADRDEDADGFVDAEECDALDGRNLMFNDTESVQLTAGQAAVLRANPLFRAP